MHCSDTTLQTVVNHRHDTVCRLWSIAGLIPVCRLWSITVLMPVCKLWSITGLISVCELWSITGLIPLCVSLELKTQEKPGLKMAYICSCCPQFQRFPDVLFIFLMPWTYSPFSCPEFASRFVSWGKGSLWTCVRGWIQGSASPFLESRDVTFFFAFPCLGGKGRITKPFSKLALESRPLSHW